jgi:hypothetical protein
LITSQLALLGKQRHLYEIAASSGIRGISSMQIMAQLYADDPGGGPVSPNIICVMVGHVNRHLESSGLAIKGRSGPGGIYRLITNVEERNAL